MQPDHCAHMTTWCHFQRNEARDRDDHGLASMWSEDRELYAIRASIDTFQLEGNLHFAERLWPTIPPYVVR